MEARTLSGNESRVVGACGREVCSGGFSIFRAVEARLVAERGEWAVVLGEGFWGAAGGTEGSGVVWLEM